MTFRALSVLLFRELFRAKGALRAAGLGIFLGTLLFSVFSALGSKVRTVLLGEVFPLDRIELLPEPKPEPGLLTLLLGGGKTPPPGIPQATIDILAAHPGAKSVSPKLKFAFPSGAFGGKEILGKDMGTHEMLADGVDPALVNAAKRAEPYPYPFEDPFTKAGPACTSDTDCRGDQYCEQAYGEPKGWCSDPVPAVVSPYLVEIFNKGIAPAHNLPPIGGSLLSRASGLVFRMELGISMMGRSKRGGVRNVKARLVGTSDSAIDLGVTVPLPVVQRWNAELYGPEAAREHSSVVVRTKSPDEVARIVELGRRNGLVPKDERARDISVMVTGIVALLTLVALAMLTVAATNTAYVFRVLVSDRRAEIGLYRALGASPGDVAKLFLSLSVVTGLSASALGLFGARLLAKALDVAAASGLPDFPFKPASFFSFDPWIIGATLGLGTGFAVLGALSSVRSASRVDPAAALA